MSTDPSGLLLGDSPAMSHLRAMIVRVAPSHLPILIEGPTGAGKELVARAVHNLSGRSGALVAFNVCAIADSMFEDAMFGHVRGAFTGAISDGEGYLAQAHEGTVFFDEIGGLNLGAQAKLLRALETRQFRPVGGKRDLHSAFRVIAATARPLEELCREGAFRDDLRHRLGKVVLRVLPLAERREDIPLLVAHFLRTVDGRHLAITQRALDHLSACEWPGNVRELRALVEAMAVLSRTGKIDMEDVLALTGGRILPVRLSFEIQRTVEVVREYRGDVYTAAGVLGVDPTTVYRRLRRAGVGHEAAARGAPSASRLQLKSR